MRRSHPSVLPVLACLGSALLLASPACSDDAGTAAQIARDAGADARAALDGATPTDGVAGSGNGGSGATDAAASGGATDAQLGKESGGAASGGRGPVTAGDGGTGGTVGTCDMAAAKDGSEPEPLAFCARLQRASVLAFDVTRAYDHEVFGDCRVAWVIDLYLDVDKRPDFLNTLLAWNMKLWGCTAPAPEDFALIFQAVPLTAGDAAALIDDYVKVATQALELSPAEITELRAALGHLARPLIADASCQLSNSRCIVDAGAGGSSGDGGSAATGGSNAGGGSTNDASSSTDGALDASRSAEASAGGAAN